MSLFERAPLINEFSLNTDAESLYLSLGKNTSHSFWLDSGMDHHGAGRYSFMGFNPFLVLRTKGEDVELVTKDGHRSFTSDPYKCLKELLREYRMKQTREPVPFQGGAVGFFSYDLGRQIERLPAQAIDDLETPDIYLGFYSWIIAIDHLKNIGYLITTGLPEQNERARQRCASEDTAMLLPKIKAVRPVPQPVSQPVANILASPPRANFTPAAYRSMVSRAKEYIAAGDIFQVNLSQRFSAELYCPVERLFCSLRKINPAPFAALLQFPDMAVASSSPERYLQLRGNRVETKPIKGTRPRGMDPASDLRLRQELWSSEKDHAELVMIVDLERNDLGRVCEFGSVKVPELFVLEEYATVFHLVSTVTGTLAPKKDVVDLLKATFPGGSITGAPKVRAMEIIEELEPVRRGVYTGSIGYLSFGGDADLNIVIRTMIIKSGGVHLQVGGGIIADSDPEAEYQETLDKARALFRTLDSRYEERLVRK